jgi:wyosine [tRNA(Phe)-imidazoG37] synthetase (radical SAM superfamily)
VERAVRERLTLLRDADAAVKRITFSGNGEPTAHPRFSEIVEAVRRARDELLPQARIAVLTNGAHLDRPEVVSALDRCDEPIVKVDAGNERMFRLLNGPGPGTTLADVVSGIRRLRAPAVQSMFVCGSVDNTAQAQVDDWMQRLREIRPANLQMYTIDRVPADRGLFPASRRRLMEIAVRVLEECGIAALVVFP